MPFVIEMFDMEKYPHVDALLLQIVRECSWTR